mmetsp:Transcript_33296/g.81823  ORF Transcript_33296/g.81823 Transcript_33296/m.81823 type:complete len:123 (-) Transcript_33296:212-580(-)
MLTAGLEPVVVSAPGLVLVLAARLVLVLAAVPVVVLAPGLEPVLAAGLVVVLAAKLVAVLTMGLVVLVVAVLVVALAVAPALAPHREESPAHVRGQCCGRHGPVPHECQILQVVLYCKREPN